uniref:Branched-chain amino acid ABC transporter permease n=1 Tax=Thermofilum pendens TaxID=2269 RepID=A0A7C4BAR0_THEPE
MEKLRQLVLPQRAAGYVALALMLVVPWVDRPLASSLSLAYVWAVLAMSYNILLGFTGIASFGHALPFGVGAFLTAFLLNRGAPYLPTILTAGLAAGTAYMAVGLPAYRVKGIYYAILTLAVAEALRTTIESTARTTVAVTVGAIPELASLAGLYIYLAVFTLATVLASISAVQNLRYTRRRRLKAAKGMSYALLIAGLVFTVYTALESSAGFLAGIGAGAPYVRILRFIYPLNVYLLSALALYLSYLAIKRLSQSPLGATLVAIRENPTRASVLGYNVFAHQLAAFFASGFFAGIAGSIYVASVPTVMTDVFATDKTFTALTGTVLGGLGTLVGPVIGGIAVGVLRDYLSSISPALLLTLGVSLQQAQLLPSFILGAIYIAVVLALPYGIWGTWLLRGWKLKRRFEKLLEA